MAYEIQTWADGEEGGTPISADALNHMEQGIQDASEAASEAPTWDDVTGKPSSFPAGDHTHEIDDVNGLTDALAGKASKVNQGQASMLEEGTDTAGRPWAAKDIADYVQAQIAAALPPASEE